MENHFHLLLRVTERAQFLFKLEKGPQEERERRLFEHLGALYSRGFLAQLKAELEVVKEEGICLPGKF
jgi:hypothetical protein